MNKTENTKFFLCDCYTHGLLISFDEKEKEIDIALYSYGEYNPNPNIWQRLKYAWYHIKTGKKYQDQVILTYDKVKELIEYLNKNIYK